MSPGIFQFQHTPGAHAGAYAAAYTAGPGKRPVCLGLGTHIYPHLTVGGTVSTGDAHVFFYPDMETPCFLYKT